MTSPDTVACCAIAQNIANFAFRDEGRWEALRDLFHPQALIAVSWYRGSIDGFIDASRGMAGAPEVLTKHWFGTPRIKLDGRRALSEVDVAIKVRSKIGKLEVDVTSYTRFFDRFEQCADGCWRIVDRTAIYEQDRIDPVQPSLLFGFLYRLARFDRYPAEYRHLAFGLDRKGLRLAEGTVVAHSVEEAALKSAATNWLTDFASQQA